MSSLIGQCSACCTCPSPLLAIITRSASKSKCGAINPSDSQYYLQQVEDVNLSYSNSGDGFTCFINANYTSTSTWDSLSCISTCVTEGGVTENSSIGSSTSSVTSTPNGPCDSWTVVGVFSPNSSDDYTNPNAPGPVIATENCGEPTGGTTTSYSNEYTTSVLQSNTVSALPEWTALVIGGDGEGAELASAELSMNEYSYSISESKYQWVHQISPTGYYTLTWNETFTPDGGGTPIKTAQSYIWDGVIPDNYNYLDNTTWPKSSSIEKDYPASNGIITITDLVIKCIKDES